ncbi:MAG: hypothetical protein JWP74_3462 [Marmoricola sp.]|nr:hypothetical protein [Marmoricola sp.]
MAAVLIPVALVLIAVVAVALALVRFSQSRGAQQEALEADPRVLRYVVPEGQDPAVVLAEFQGLPLEVAPAPGEAVHEILISSPAGRPAVDREQVRTLLAGVQRTSLDADAPAPLPPVRFADEG